MNSVKHAYTDSTDNGCVICNVYSTLAHVQIAVLQLR